MKLIKTKNLKNKIFSLHKLDCGKFQISYLLVNTSDNAYIEAEINKERMIFNNLEKAILFWNKNIEKI